jgi:hypothetical protein
MLKFMLASILIFMLKLKKKGVFCIVQHTWGKWKVSPFQRLHDGPELSYTRTCGMCGKEQEKEFIKRP